MKSEHPFTVQNDKPAKRIGRREMLRYGASLAGVTVLGGSRVSGFGQMTARAFAEVTKELAVPQASKPNIVFILMDNLGYGEVGCYGGGELRSNRFFSWQTKV